MKGKSVFRQILTNIRKDRANSVVLALGFIILPICILFVIGLNIWSVRQMPVWGEQLILTPFGIEISDEFKHSIPGVEVRAFRDGLSFYVTEGFSEDSALLHFGVITNALVEYAAGLGYVEEPSVLLPNHAFVSFSELYGSLWDSVEETYGLTVSNQFALLLESQESQVFMYLQRDSTGVQWVIHLIAIGFAALLFVLSVSAFIIYLRQRR